MWYSTLTMSSSRIRIRIFRTRTCTWIGLGLTGFDYITGRNMTDRTRYLHRNVTRLKCKGVSRNDRECHVGLTLNVWMTFMTKGWLEMHRTFPHSALIMMPPHLSILSPHGAFQPIFPKRPTDPVQGKGKEHLIYEATSSQIRTKMARVVKGSHSFTCHWRIYPRMEGNIPAFAFPVEDGPHLPTLEQ